MPYNSSFPVSGNQQLGSSLLLPPDIQAQYLASQLQQRTGSEMMQGGLTPINPFRTAGKYVVPISPWEGMNKLGQTLAGTLLQRKAIEGQVGMSKQYNDYLVNALSGGQQQPSQSQPQSQPQQLSGPGMPITPTTQDGGQQQTPGGQTGGYTVADGGSQVGSQLAKIRLLEGAGIPAAYGKRFFADWETVDVQIGNGITQKMMINKNNPQERIPVGAQSTPQLHPVEGTSPTGQPITTWRNPYAPGADIQRPVENVYHDFGANVQTVPKFGQGQPQIVGQKTIPPGEQANLAYKKSLNLLGNEPEQQTARQQIAQGLADGTIDPKILNRMSPMEKAALATQAKQTDPNFDMAQYSIRQAAETKFLDTNGNQIRRFGVYLDHMGVVKDIYNAMQQGNLQAVNQLQAKYQLATGHPAPAQLALGGQVLANELQNAVGGGPGSVEERQALIKDFSNASSPQQVNGVFSTAQELAVGQLRGQHQQYQSIVGKYRGSQFADRFLSPQAAAFYHQANMTHPEKDIGGAGNQPANQGQVKFLGYE